MAWSGTVPTRSSISLPEQLSGLQQRNLPPGAAGRGLLEEMVQALVGGAVVDWVHWYEGQRWCWCQPPGHPFLRSSFWWTPRKKATESSKASLWLDHLGLARSDVSQASDQGLSVQIHLPVLSGSRQIQPLQTLVRSL